MRKCNRVLDGHRSPFVAGAGKLLNSERLLGGTHIPLTDPADFGRKGAPDTSEQFVRGAPELGRIRDTPLGREHPRKNLEAPGDAARILKLLAQRKHL